MEIWYDSATMEVKAVYAAVVKTREGYSGTVWADRGYAVYADDQPLPRGMSTGAKLSFDVDGKPAVAEPPPAPEPDPVSVRLGELVAKLMTEDLTIAELNEMKRLERGR